MTTTTTAAATTTTTTTTPTATTYYRLLLATLTLSQQMAVRTHANPMKGTQIPRSCIYTYNVQVNVPYMENEDLEAICVLC